MEARLCRFLLILAAIGSVAAANPPQATKNFSYPTKNFVVYAPSPQIAQQVAIAAEKFRKELAIEWLGHELPGWSAPCPIKVKVGQIGAGGATTFSFHPVKNGPAEVCGWDMQIQGSLERILDSVLPHEVSHTIFACHFRRPLPRWADEGAATLVEHESERRTQVLRVQQVLNSRRRIPLKTLLTIKEYPQDMQDVMTLYAEGYSLAELLVQKGGKTRYLKFINDAHQNGWEKAIQSQYGYKGIDDLEKQWHEWIIAGSPELNLPEGQMLADNSDKSKDAAAKGYVLRGQSPDAATTQELSEDPFLGNEVASKKRLRRRQNNEPPTDSRSLPVTLGEEDSSANATRRDDLLSSTSGSRHNDDWQDLTQFEEEPVDATERDPADDGHWVEVPRQAPRARPKTTASRNETVRTPTQNVPSVARQRQTSPSEPRVGRFASRPYRTTPWSEAHADPRPSPFHSEGAHDVTR